MTITLRTGEAKDVIEPSHSTATRALTNNTLIALDTGPEVVAVRRAVRQRLEMFLLQDSSFRREYRLIDPIHVISKLQLL